MLKKLQTKYPTLEYAVIALVILFVSVTYATTLNLFLVPGHIYSGGVMGFSQIIAYFFNKHTSLPFTLQPATLNFILNIPIIILGFVQLGKRFTVLSLFIVAGISFFSEIIPVTEISTNPLLNGVIGGALAGTAIGTAVKYGFSAGGTDIISMVVYRKTGINIGSINLIINSMIIFGAGMIYTWEFALFTLISMYTSARMINTIHTNDHRLTVFIVTNKVDAVVNNIFRRLRRGITVVNGMGGFSKEPRSILMIVVNRYEIYELQTAIHEADDHAFVNIIQSTKVMGNYLNKQQQDDLKSELQIYREMEAERKQKRKLEKSLLK